MRNRLIDNLKTTLPPKAPEPRALLQLNQHDKHALPLPVTISEDQSRLLLDVLKIKENFYGESSEEDVSFAQERLCRQPLAPFVTPVLLTADSFGKVPRIYIETLKDKSISIEFQRELYSRTPCQSVKTLDSDHSSFFSQPEKLASILHGLSIEKG